LNVKVKSHGDQGQKRHFSALLAVRVRFIFSGKTSFPVVSATLFVCLFVEYFDCQEADDIADVYEVY